MHELGPAMPEVDAVVQHEAGSWDIWFEDDVCVALDWQLAEPRLRLSIALGEPSAAVGRAVCEALLKANLAWSAQGSVRAAMCDTGQLLLLAEPAHASCDLPALQLQLRRFIVQASQFAAVLHADRLRSEAAGELRGDASHLPDSARPCLSPTLRA